MHDDTRPADPVTMADVLTVGLILFSGFGLGVLFTITVLGR